MGGAVRDVALVGIVQMGSGALGSALVSYFHSGTAMPMAILLMASSLVSIALQVGYRRFEQKVVL